MRREFWVVVAALNTGCVAFDPCFLRDPKNKKQYHVSMCASPEQGGAAGARDMALSEANKKCASLGRTIDVGTILMARPPPPEGGSATVYFSCK